MKFAIYNATTKSYIAVQNAEYIYTKLPGHIRKFDTFLDAENFKYDVLQFHPDYRVRDIHSIVEVK
uniref:Uncharacterized protein n=1 Tax=Ochrobactrum phage ORM_20 TaxID=2985243 RepID=A0A9N6WS81_9VIRU|nr:hypothetical protein ORM20_00220 [Ochrobactrum phage ORM_20]